MNKTEILSPAGNKDCLIAAVNAGADAIYLAGNMFGARAYAGNFNNEELIWAIKYAHLNGRKIYLTVNTLCKNPQFKLIFDYIKPLYETGLDAVIVQDMGVVSFLMKCFPDLDIHLSTQATITSTEAVEDLAALGVKRLVLARELTLDEIKNIYNMGLDIEIFIHGAMCYSYSGQCLFSSFLGDRSANRGRCAQPCRQCYKLEGKGKGEYILSLKDMCLAENMKEIMALGPMSLKIEGRMKDASYVSAVTGIYRKLIDDYYLKGDIVLTPKDVEILDNTYVRKDRSNGYINRIKSPDMITLNKATYNHEDTKEAETTVYPIKGDLKAKLSEGEKASVLLETVIDEKNIEVTVLGPVVEEAKNYPLNSDDVKKRLSKSGDALIKPIVKDVILSDKAYLNVKDINELRRNAIDKLTDRIIKLKNTNNAEAVNVFNDKDFDYDNKTALNEIIVYVNDALQLQEVLDFDFYNAISIPSYMLKFSQIEEYLNKIRKSGKRIFIHLPYVVRQPQVKSIISLIDKYIDFIDAIYVNQLDSYYMIHKIFPEITIKGDINLYVYNNEAALFYKYLSTYTVPTELTKQELKHLNLSKGDMIIYGKIPFMHTANCVKFTKNQCLKGKGNINYTYLTDRKNTREGVILHCGEDICYNTIVNGLPLCLFDKLKEVTDLHPLNLSIRFTDEDKNTVRNVLNSYLNANNEDKVNFEHTKGHFNNGIL